MAGLPDDEMTPFGRRPMSADERELNANTIEGFRNIARYLIWPYPGLALTLLLLGNLIGVDWIKHGGGFLFLGWLGWLGWTYRARIWRFFKGPRKSTPMEQKSHAQALADWRAEAKTAVRAAELDTVEGDIQIAAQLPAFHKEIARLTEIGPIHRTNEQNLALEHLTRAVREITMIKTAQTDGVHAVSEQPMQGFSSFLPSGSAGMAKLFPWFGAVQGVIMGLLILLGVVQTYRVSELKEDLGSRDALLLKNEEDITELSRQLTRERRDHALAMNAISAERDRSVELRRTERTIRDAQDARVRRRHAQEIEMARTGEPLPLDDWLRELAGTGETGQGGPATDPVAPDSAG